MSLEQEALLLRIAANSRMQVVHFHPEVSADTDIDAQARTLVLEGEDSERIIRILLHQRRVNNEVKLTITQMEIDRQNPQRLALLKEYCDIPTVGPIPDSIIFRNFLGIDVEALRRKINDLPRIDN